MVAEELSDRTAPVVTLCSDDFATFWVMMGRPFMFKMSKSRYKTNGAVDAAIDLNASNVQLIRRRPSDARRSRRGSGEDIAENHPPKGGHDGCPREVVSVTGAGKYKFRPLSVL